MLEVDIRLSTSCAHQLASKDSCFKNAHYTSKLRFFFQHHTTMNYAP